jgi:predicted transcriptional regulator of viral defense system
MDRLEALIKSDKDSGTGTAIPIRRKTGGQKKRNAGGRSKNTATEKVISIIGGSPTGVDVSTLKSKSGFEDKKVRNIVFRLCKEGAIKRIGRGIYTIG